MSLGALLGSLLLFAVVVAIHEFGHYLAVRCWGDRPSKFAVGMGPTLFQVSYAGTEWSLRLIPIGGFLKVNRGDVQTILLESPISRGILYCIAVPLAYLFIWPAMLLMAAWVFLVEAVAYPLGQGRKATAWRRHRIGELFGTEEKKEEKEPDPERELPQEDLGPPFDRHGWFAEFVLSCGGPAINVATAYLVFLFCSVVLNGASFGEGFERANAEVSRMAGLVWDVFTRFVLLIEFPQFNGPIEGFMLRAETIERNVVNLETALLLFARFSLVLAFINLFPIPGLDGSHASCALVRAVLPVVWYRHFRATFFALVVICMLSLMGYVLIRDVLYINGLLG